MVPPCSAAGCSRDGSCGLVPPPLAFLSAPDWAVPGVGRLRLVTAPAPPAGVDHPARMYKVAFSPEVQRYCSRHASERAADADGLAAVSQTLSYCTLCATRVDNRFTSFRPAHAMGCPAHHPELAALAAGGD